MNPTDTNRIERLIHVASQLVEIMSREVALLRAMRVVEIGDLQQEKLELTSEYEGAIAALAEEPELLQAMEPALRSELAEIAARFDAAVDENARALTAVKESHDRLLQAIVDAVAEERSRQKAYTAKGALDNPRSTRCAPPISLTVDQRL